MDWNENWNQSNIVFGIEIDMKCCSVFTSEIEVPVMRTGYSIFMFKIILQLIQ